MNMLTKHWLSLFVLMLMVVNAANGFNSQPDPPGLMENDYLPPSDVPPRRLRSIDGVRQPEPTRYALKSDNTNDNAIFSSQSLKRRLLKNNNEGVIVDQRRLRTEIDEDAIGPDIIQRRLRENDESRSIIFFRRLRGEENDAIGPEFKGRRLRENQTNDNNAIFSSEPNDKMSVPDAPERRPPRDQRVHANQTDDSIPSIIFFRRLRGEENNDAVPDPWNIPPGFRRLNEESEEPTANGIIVHDAPARRLRGGENDFNRRRLRQNDDPTKPEPWRRLNEENIIVQDKESSLARRLQKKMKQQRPNQTSLPPVDLPIVTSKNSPMTTEVVETIISNDSNTPMPEDDHELPNGVVVEFAVRRLREKVPRSTDNKLPMTTDEDENDLPSTTIHDDEEEHEKNNRNRQPKPFPRNRKLINNDENGFTY